jgi:L-iditol 2-dehydrogenase
MIEAAHTCGNCDQCLAGRFNTCRNIQFMSSAEEMQGCMCEQVVVPEQNCFLIPDELSFEQAAVAEPLSISLYSVKRSIPLSASTPIAILGAGPIGLCTMLAARAMGAERVYITEKIPARIALAQELGATWTGNPDASNVVSEVGQAEPLGLSVVFECSGSPEALDQAVEMLGPGGLLVITGIPDAHRISLNIDNLRRKELSVFNVRRQNETVKESIELLASGRINIDALITHRVPLSDAKHAFDLVADYADGVVKAMVVND